MSLSYNGTGSIDSKSNTGESRPTKYLWEGYLEDTAWRIAFA
jgi:hypothetical protein